MKLIYLKVELRLKCSDYYKQLGSGEATAREYLIANYKERMSFEDLVKLALKALKESIDEEAAKENIRLAYIKSEDKAFHMCSKEEVEQFLTELEKKV